SDPDVGHEGDSLTLSVVNVTNPTLFAPQPTISGTTLTLPFAPDQNGSSGVTVRATDSHGASVDFALLANGGAVNDPPVVANALPDKIVNEDAPPIVINLANVFSDVDIATNGDSLTLTLANAPDPALASAVVSGTTLTLTLVADANGSTQISIQAKDSAGAT